MTTALYEILRQAARSDSVSDDVLEEALYDLCDDLHACDCESCPVVRACEALDGKLHKNGKGMLAAMRDEVVKSS